MKQFGRIIKISLLLLAGLMLIISLSLQIPAVQNYIAGIAMKRLEEKLHTTVSLGSIRVVLPNSITLKELYIEDQNRDTLVDAGMIRVNLGLLGLLRKNIIIRRIEIHDVTGNIFRAVGDSSFNYSFIPAAFSDTLSDVPSDTAAGAKTAFTIRRVKLSNIRVSYKDQMSGNNLSSHIGNLSVRFRNFSLNPLNIVFGRIELQNSYARLSLSGVGTEESSFTKPAISLENTVKLKDVSIFYEDKASGRTIDIVHAGLSVSPEKIDIGNELISLNRVMIQNTTVSVRTGRMEKSPSDPATGENGDSFGWDISAADVILRDNSIHFEMDSAPVPTGGTDFNHLWFRNISGNVSDITLNDNGYMADVRQFSFRESSGFELVNLKGNAAISDTAFRLTGFQLKTPNSFIDGSFQGRFSSFAALSTAYPDAYFNIEIRNSHLGTKDLEFFLPNAGLNHSPTVLSYDRINMAANIEGKLADVNIRSFDLNAGNDLMVLLNGKIRGLPDYKVAEYDLKLDTLRVAKGDILAFTPDSLIPSSIHLPERISMAGNFKGRMGNFSADLGVKSTQGSFSAGLIYHEGDHEGRERYSGHVFVDNYDLGELLHKADTLGKLSLEGHFSGSSRNFKQPDVSFDFTVGKLTAFQYTYHDIKLAGDIADHIFNGNVAISDTNLVASFEGKATLSDTVPSYNFMLNIEGMDAGALHLTRQDVRLRGKIRTDFAGGDIDSINGYLKAYDFVVVRDGEFYPVDSVVLNVSNDQEKTELKLKSPFINANYSGTLAMGELPGVMNAYLNRYFDLQKDTSETMMIRGKFEFSARIENADLLSKLFLPEFRDLVQADIKASFDSEKPSLDLAVNFPEVNYNGIIADTIKAVVSAGKEQLDWEVDLAHLYATPFEILSTNLKGSISMDTIQWELLSDIGKDTASYYISGKMQSREKVFFVQFDSSRLILNKQNFTIPSDNYLKFSNSGIESHHMEFMKDDQKLSFTTGTESDTSSHALRFEFTHFNINTLTAFISGRSEILGANVDGIFEIPGKSSFHSDLTLTDVEFFGQDVFKTVSIEAENEKSGSIGLLAKFEGEENNMDIRGSFDTSHDPVSLDVNAHIGNLSLAYFQPFVKKEINEMKGGLSGSMSIVNTIANPEINGYVAFNDVSITPAFTRSQIILKHERITFDRRRISLNQLSLRDSPGNTMTINGTIDASDPRNPAFDLDLNTKKFQFLDTGSESRNMFYGHLVAGLKASVIGRASNPDIVVDADLAHDSHFYFMVPEASSASIEQKGVVVFMQSSSDTASKIFSRNTKGEQGVTTDLNNIHLTANISISNSMQMTIIVDPATDEALDIKGSGDLSYDIKGNGQMTLAGTYQVEEGSYSLTMYEILKRKFNIEKGSSLTWTGDVANPQLDLTTWYPVKTSPEPIISPQMPGMTKSQNLQYSGSMDFNVYMYIKGHLMQPSISFGIQQPPSERDANISARLAQLNSNESELNKQVFSLLLFENFLEENMFTQNSFAYNLSSTARKGIGNILAQQINRFSQEYLPGVNFNMNINSYAVNSSRQTSANTSVEMNLYKKMLDNRLSIQVGGNINIAENNPNTTSPANVNNIAGDVVVEYYLTKNGIYRMQAFNKNEYEDVLDGAINKTGVAFIFNKDFYKFKNLFTTEKGTDKSLRRKKSNK